MWCGVVVWCTFPCLCVWCGVVWYCVQPADGNACITELVVTNRFCCLSARSCVLCVCTFVGSTRMMQVVTIEKFGHGTAEAMAAQHNITTGDILHHYKYQVHRNTHHSAPHYAMEYCNTPSPRVIEHLPHNHTTPSHTHARLATPPCHTR